MGRQIAGRHLGTEMIRMAMGKGHHIHRVSILKQGRLPAWVHAAIGGRGPAMEAVQQKMPAFRLHPKPRVGYPGEFHASTAFSFLLPFRMQRRSKPAGFPRFPLFGPASEAA